MKQFAFLLSLFILSRPFGSTAQNSDQLSRVTLGLELGSGMAGNDCCSYNLSYYKIGVASGYRLSRLFSLEANLFYLNLEGLVNGYSNGTIFQLSAFQQWNNATLMLGPSLHLASRNGFEWSLAPKAGFMMNNVSQEISNYGQPYQNRQYKTSFVPALEANLRMSWWFTDRLAFETSLGYFGSLNSNKLPTLKSAKGIPIPGDNQALPASYLEEINQTNSEIFALNLSLGLRFRL